MTGRQQPAPESASAAVDRYLSSGPTDCAHAAAGDADILARCDAVMALAPKLASRADVAWAFEEASRLARSPAPAAAPRWFARAGLAWGVAGSMASVAVALGAALLWPGLPPASPPASTAAGPSITFAPVIIPAGFASRLAEVDPVVLIANQVPVDGRSIAVLPFSGRTSPGDADSAMAERAAAAIYGRLMQQLATIPGLYVIEPTLAATYADTELTPEEIAVYLGVRGVVEGRVSADSDTVSLGMRFTDAAGDGTAIDTNFAAAPERIDLIESGITASLLDALSIRRPPAAGRSL